jgi:hypothetical protein
LVYFSLKRVRYLCMEDLFFDKPDCLSFLEPSYLSNQLEIKNYSIHIDLINLILSMRRYEFLDPK